MELIKSHPLLRVKQEEMHKVRQFYGIHDVDKIKECLKMVKEWCQKERHLKGAYEYLNDDVLERLFLLSRGSVEATKIKIDKLCTARGLVPELCLNRHLDEFSKLRLGVHHVVLPYLNPTDQSRLLLIKIISTDADHLDILLLVRFMLMIGDYRLHHDYNLSDKIIVDFDKMTAKHLTKLNPITIKKAQMLWTEGYGAKLSGIHVVNASSFVDKVVFILKQSFKEKVAKRFYVHQTFEGLGDHIAKEVLPKDYGGDLPSIANLYEQWQDTINSEECQKIIKDADKLVADETKRSSSKFNEEHLGMSGSFRQMHVD